MSPSAPKSMMKKVTMVEIANIPEPKSPLAQLENISKSSSSIIKESTPSAYQSSLNTLNNGLSSKKRSSFVYQDVLRDVVAYVEVRSEMEDLSLLFGEHLLFLGATVSRTFNKKVTLVVFKRGKESTFKKAKERSIPVVSVVWVDQCKKQNCHVPEESYLIKDYKTYGKRLKLLYNDKHTQMIEDKEKSFEETKKIVENIKMSKKRNGVSSPKETPRNITEESISPLDCSSPKISPPVIFTPKVSKSIKRKLFLGNPTSESTPLVNKKRKQRSPSIEQNEKKFKLNEEDGKENEELLLIETENDAPETIDNNQFSLHQQCDRFLNNRRRSLDNFEVTKPHQSVFRNQPKITNETKTIVFTSCNESMIITATAIVECLGGFKIENDVTEHTTHVICGEYKRTLNLLYGLMRGCFILDGEYLMSSFENKEWLDERHFELIEYFPSAQVRQPEIINIFKDCGPFFISPNTSPPAHDLVNLINLGGGEVTTCYRRCSVIVGNFRSHATDENPYFIRVDEKFIMDCISGFKKFKA